MFRRQAFFPRVKARPVPPAIEVITPIPAPPPRAFRQNPTHVVPRTPFFPRAQVRQPPLGISVVVLAPTPPPRAFRQFSRDVLPYTPFFPRVKTRPVPLGLYIAPPKPPPSVRAYAGWTRYVRREAFFPRAVSRWLAPTIPTPLVEPRQSIQNLFVLHIEGVLDEVGNPVEIWASTKAMITGDADTPAAMTFNEHVHDPGVYRRQVFGGSRATGFVSPTFGSIELNNAEDQYGEWVDYATDGAKVTCWFGPYGGVFPDEWRQVYIVYVDGRPTINSKTMRLNTRGRERLFDQPVVTDGFDGSGDSQGTGVAGSSVRQMVLGRPWYISPILIHEVDNIWFLSSTPLTGALHVYDGGVELESDGLYGSESALFAALGAPSPGSYKLYTGDGMGDSYIRLGSFVRVELRVSVEGCYRTPMSSTRRWNILDLAVRAGVTDAEPGNMPSGSEVLDAGDRLITTETYKQVLSDVALAEVASIGFDRLDRMFARRLVPSGTTSTRYTFVEDQNSKSWVFSPISGLGKRVWRVRCQSGTATKSSLAGVVPDVIRDNLCRNPWVYDFAAEVEYPGGMFAPPKSVKDFDPGSEEVVVQIQDNHFSDRTEMLEWSTRFMKVHSARQTCLTLDAPFSREIMDLELLDSVLLSTDRYGGDRSGVIIGIDAQLKSNIIRFTLWGHFMVPADDEVYLRTVDDAVGAGGGGAGSGSTGEKDAAPQIESFVIAVSDELTALTVGNNKRTFFCPYDFVITEMIASLVVPQGTGSIFTVDVNIDAITALSTKLTIDNTDISSLDASTSHVLSQFSMGKGAKVTVDIDQVGDGTAKGLIVSLVGYRAGS